MALLGSDRNPDISLHRNFIGQNTLQTSDALADKGRQQSNAKPGNSGIALSEDTVAMETHDRGRDDFVKPANRIDGQQIVDVPDKNMPIEILARSRRPVAAQVFFRAIEEKRECPEQRALEPARIGIEEAQKDIGFLAVEIDRLRNADQLDFTPGPNCSSAGSRRAR